MKNVICTTYVKITKQKIKLKRNFSKRKLLRENIEGHDLLTSFEVFLIGKCCVVCYSNIKDTASQFVVRNVQRFTHGCCYLYGT